MPYKVVPFNAQVEIGDGADRAAAQLEQLVNEKENDAWVFQGLETIETTVVTPAVPGTNGCLGIGGTVGSPERRNSASAYVAVFRQK